MRRKPENPQNPAGISIPVTLPLVVATVQENGETHVAVNGVMLVEGPIERDALGRVLSAIAEDEQTPIRVEVHEADGRVFADILTPPPPRSRFAPPPVAPATAPAPPALIEFYGQGFVPGEDVAVAVIMTRTSAAGTGFARAVLERRQLPGPVTDVLLFGEISGTIVRQGPEQ